MNKVLYISPLTGNMKYMVDAEGVKYHAQRDQAVLKIKELTGNVDAFDEVNKQFKIIHRAKRMINRKGYFATPVIAG